MAVWFPQGKFLWKLRRWTRSREHGAHGERFLSERKTKADFWFLWEHLIISWMHRKEKHLCFWNSTPGTLYAVKMKKVIVTISMKANTIPHCLSCMWELKVEIINLNRDFSLPIMRKLKLYIDKKTLLIAAHIKHASLHLSDKSNTSRKRTTAIFERIHCSYQIGWEARSTKTEGGENFLKVNLLKLPDDNLAKAAYRLRGRTGK